MTTIYSHSEFCAPPPVLTRLVFSRLGSTRLFFSSLNLPSLVLTDLTLASQDTAAYGGRARTQKKSALAERSFLTPGGGCRRFSTPNVYTTRRGGDGLSLRAVAYGEPSQKIKRFSGKVKSGHQVSAARM